MLKLKMEGQRRVSKPDEAKTDNNSKPGEIIEIEEQTVGENSYGWNVIRKWLFKL
ncbi:hypothetical protein A2U01_0000965 [Trifolium medium]|uniref:Uncharacterized protein n=1 Tax=Trifolium medium TaxID=97028 RepID=A0A392LYZ1_9FABA|nr:hypothetical protein [Trifolium medium]